jgi:hypothetical protein
MGIQFGVTAIDCHRRENDPSRSVAIEQLWLKLAGRYAFDLPWREQDTKTLTACLSSKTTGS